MKNIKVSLIRKLQGAIEIKEHGDLGIISIRYGGNKGVFHKVNSIRLMGSELPTNNEIIFLDRRALAWMSNDEIWVITSKNEVKKTIGSLASEIKILNGLLVDISATRVMFSLKGNLWRDVIAKGCPADISDRSLASGIIRRTRLGLVPVAVWCQDEENAFIVCNRSVREYVFDWLENASFPNSVPEFH